MEIRTTEAWLERHAVLSQRMLELGTVPTPIISDPIAQRELQQIMEELKTIPDEAWGILLSDEPEDYA